MHRTPHLIRHVLTTGLVVFGTIGRAAAAETAPAVKLDQGKTYCVLSSGKRVVWRLNYGPDFAKPCLHPLTFADGREATALRPPDHRWHTGLWFSWKYLNGVNYWEEDPKTGKAEGITEVTAVQVRRGDKIVTVEMNLAYHKPEEKPVLTERRTLVLHDPDTHGDTVLDWISVFTVRVPELKFDRTPPVNKPGEPGRGGYAGLNIRLNPSMKKDGTFRADKDGPGAAKLFGVHAKWMDFSLPADQSGAGVMIMDHPSNLRHPTCWYPNQGYPFFSPVILFEEPLNLKEGNEFTLRYRVWLHNGAVGPDELNAAWKAYAPSIPQTAPDGDRSVSTPAAPRPLAPGSTR